jgi:glyoxylase-like metal-dependent hydrolase (beta-lactamase superfamily II)
LVAWATYWFKSRIAMCEFIFPQSPFVPCSLDRTEGIAMPAHGADLDLRYPFAEPPGLGEVKAVADGILWVRIPLPFRLDHINVYLIEDGDGWAVLDTGIRNDETREIWESLVAGPLRGRRLTRLIVTHLHPDHIGLAGWLCRRFDLPLLTSQNSYLGCWNISLSPGALDAKPYRDFYLEHGLSPELTDQVVMRGHNYLTMVDDLPPTFTRLVQGDTLNIGGRRWSVLTGEGHAPEQVMLYCASDRLFLAADQVLAKISPNVSVWAVDPDGDPLGLYIRSLGQLMAALPGEALVLPGHQLPFYGLHTRAAQLIEHHERRCALIAEACRIRPRSAAELVPVMFTRALDPHQMSFAFSEVQAHVNYMLRTDRLQWSETNDGIHRAVAS